MEWIDVKERKPKVNQIVLMTIYSPGYFDDEDGHLVSDDYDVLLGRMYNEENGFWDGYNEKGGWGRLTEEPADPEDYRVIAWMPVEPYKFKERDKMDNKKFTVDEILEIIGDVYVNDLGPIPGADIHDFYAALNARFVQGGINES